MANTRTRTGFGGKGLNISQLVHAKLFAHKAPVGLTDHIGLTEFDPL